MRLKARLSLDMISMIHSCTHPLSLLSRRIFLTAVESILPSCTHPVPHLDSHYETGSS